MVDSKIQPGNGFYSLQYNNYRGEKIEWLNFGLEANIYLLILLQFWSLCSHQIHSLRLWECSVEIHQSAKVLAHFKFF